MLKTESIDSRAWVPLSTVARMTGLSRPAAERFLKAGQVRTRTLPGQRRSTAAKTRSRQSRRRRPAPSNPNRSGRNERH